MKEVHWLADDNSGGVVHYEFPLPTEVWHIHNLYIPDILKYNFMLKYTGDGEASKLNLLAYIVGVLWGHIVQGGEKILEDVEKRFLKRQDIINAQTKYQTANIDIRHADSKRTIEINISDTQVKLLSKNYHLQSLGYFLKIPNTLVAMCILNL